MPEELRGFIDAYKHLFSLPSTKKSLSLIFTLIPTWILASFTGVVKFTVQEVALYFLLLIMMLAPLHITDRKIFNSRRLLGISIYFIIWGMIFSIISHLKIIAIIPISLTLMIPSVFLLESVNIKVLYFFASSILSLIHESYLKLYVILFLILFLLIYHSIDHNVKNKVGIGGVAILRASLHYVLANRRETLENFLTRLSFKRRLPIHVYKFVDLKGETLGLIAISYIRPGPFRDLGSSSLPQKLILRSLNKGIVGIFIKGACGHGENLVKYSGLNKIINTILFDETSWREVYVEGVSRYEVKDTTCFSIFFRPNQVLCIVARRGGGMEDIPIELADDVNSKTTFHVILADSHNSEDIKGYNPKPDVGSDLYNSLLKCVLESLDKRYASVHGTLRAGFSHRDISYGGSEICPGGISFVVLEIGGEKYFLTSIDGNNMVLGLSERIRRKLMDMGFKDGEVVTTDSHIYTGIAPGRGYTPIGYNVEWSNLIRDILSAAEEAIGKLRDVRIFYKKIMHEDYYLDLEKLVTLSEYTKSNIKKGILLFNMLFTLYVLTLILGFLSL